MTVAVVGSCNLDLIVAVEELPRPGETVLGGDVLARAGGKGANQAVAAARLGADVVFLGAMGRDEFGAVLGELLSGNGLDLQNVHRVEEGPTGVALIAVDRRGENAITVAAGANRRLTPSHLAAVDAQLKVASVLLTQLEIPLGTCVRAAELVREAGGVVITNSAPLTDAADPELARLLAATDVLVANQSEACMLGSFGDVPDAAEGWDVLARQLRQLGPRTVIVTLGAQGAVVAEDAASYAVASPGVTAIDTTGAGDAFCGALAAGLADGTPIRAAVERACRAGAYATTAVGAQEAMPTGADLTPFDQEGR